jgi:hypothetical protein
MNRELSPDRLGETLGHLCRHWKEKRTAAANRLDPGMATTQFLTIALSREAGTQGTAVGHEVGTRLGWPVYDHEILERISKDMGVRTSLLESIDEQRISWLREAFESLFTVPIVSDLAYVHHLAKTILALGADGNCIIVGRGSAFILPPATTLRVHLMAPRKDRIAIIAQLRNVSHEEAGRLLDVRDRERQRFIREYFHKDPSDLRQFHLVLDVARFGVFGCAEIIVAALDCLKGQIPLGSQEKVLSS